MVKLKKTRFLAIGAMAALMACGPAYTEDPSSKDKRSENEKQEEKDKNQEKKDDKHKDNKETKILAETESNQQGKKDNGDIDIKKISEAFGHFIGRNLKSPGIEFDLDSIVKGMREGAAGQPAPMSDQDYEKMMAKLQQKAFNALAEDNLKAAEDFLTKNAKAAGVVEIVPGKLQYMIIEEGHEPTVPEHGKPMINYVGKYLDGTVFGSSEDAGGPITVPLDQTIPGFSKGLAGMKEGEKRRLFIHPELGYGRTGQMAPNSLLIFEIEAVKASSPEKSSLGASSSLDDDLDVNEDSQDLEDDLEDSHKDHHNKDNSKT